MELSAQCFKLNNMVENAIHIPELLEMQICHKYSLKCFRSFTEGIEAEN